MKRFLSGLLAVFCLALVAAPAATQDEWDEELLEPELKPDEALIFVTVNNNSGRPMEGVIISVQQGHKPTRKSYVSDARGKVKIIVPTAAVYHLRFLSLDVSQNQHTETFDIPDEEELRYKLVMTYKAPTSKVFVLEGVLFNTGKATLKRSSFKALEVLLEYLKMKPQLEIELSGHTDSVGKDEDNLKLSDDRAHSVRKWLVKKGIKGTRITAVGYGEERPVASNDTAAGRKKNRRTEVRILNE